MGTRHEPRSTGSTHPPWGICLWLTAAIIWLTWSPFVPRGSPWEPVISPPTGFLEVAGNFLLFSPLAFIVGRSTAGGPEGRPSFLAAVPGLFAACVLVEGGQIFVEGRLVSPYDFLLNLTGGIAGLRAGFRAADLNLRFRRLLDRGVILGLAFGYLVILSILAFRTPSARAGLVLEGWQDDYGVRVGDEVGGERAYQGVVERARICGGGSGDSVCVSGGADEPSRRRLTRVAQENQVLWIEATVRSRSSRQSGPTRIVTFSDGPDRRNVTLGQSGNDLILRLRTPMGGTNGTDFAFRLENGIPEGEPVDVKASYRESSVRLTATTSRTERHSSFTLTPTWTQAWLVAGFADSGYEEQPLWTAIVGGLLVLVPPGLAAGILLHDRRLVYTFLAGAGVDVILVGLIAGVVSDALKSGWLVLAIGIGALSGWMGMRDRRVWTSCGR